MIHLDFETFCELDIKKVGAYKYATHRSCKILSAAYCIDESPVNLWIPELPGLPEDLFEAIKREEKIGAHNAFFERCIWEQICVKHWGFPEVKPKQWRCTAAVASAHSLPRNLGKAGNALGLEVVKDEIGKKVMLRLSKPRKARKPTKKDPSTEHKEKASDYTILYEYNITDVEAEKALHERLGELNYEETIYWLLDQKINMRGVPIDIDLVNKIIARLNQKKERSTSELVALTDGLVVSGKQPAKLKQWFKLNGITVPNVQKETMRKLIEDPSISEKVKRVIQLRSQLGKSSVDKFEAYKRMCDDNDSRVRDTLMYHAASTGRWGGKGVQLQNLTKEQVVKNIDEVIEDIKAEKSLDELEQKYGNFSSVAASLVRSVICAEEGHSFIASDYSAIEARGLAWGAGATEVLNLFTSGREVYVEQAKKLYGNPNLTKENKNERQLGKTVILACGYGMGAPKFQLTCESWRVDLNDVATPEFLKKGIDLLVRKNNTEFREGIPLLLKERLDKLTDIDEMRSICLAFDILPARLVAEYAVSSYRLSNPEIVRFWRDMENAAIIAVKTGKPTRVTKFTWLVEKGFLYCILPSGRRLAYYAPELETITTPWGEEKYKLTYEGEETIPGSTRVVWARTSTYGGKLVENVIQAICRDIMAFAMYQAEKHKYEVSFTVHDELVTHIPDDFGSVEDLERIMCILPSWAEGFPIAAEGWRGKRYKK